MPVIIDTDPGLDDALAIFLAFASPELDVRGIVTVGGNVGLDTTTLNALRLATFLGRTDVPVVAGAAVPLRRPPIDAASIHGADGIGGIPLPEPASPPLGRDAIDWYVETIAAHPPGSLRILALGPLTNLARLIEQHPEAARRLGGIIAMGGAVRERGNVTPHAEFNIAADPEAAEVVVRSGIPLVLVPLDVTRKVAATAAWAADLAARGGRVARLSGACITAYLGNIAALRARLAAEGKEVPPTRGDICPLHDPCVMIHAVDPTIFSVERLPLVIVTDGSEKDGATVIDAAAGHPVDVLTGVASERALTFVAGRLASCG